MSTIELTNILFWLEPLVCVAALCLLIVKGQARSFKYLGAYLGARGLINFLCYALAFRQFFEVHLAYKVLFYVYWSGYAIEAVLGFLLIYSLYQMAMAPLPGIQRLGTIMFRWAAGISVAVALGTTLAPQITQSRFIIRFVTGLQEIQSILTLCMLLFVCVMAYPLGMSYRSKIFGVSAGLGVVATSDLVGAAWLSRQHHLASVYNTVNGVSICVTIAIWIAYFVMQEPARRMIVLPTTSPFLRWNQISMALDDQPGYVVVSEVTSDLFAPAELEVMRRASVMISARKRNEAGEFISSGIETVAG